MPSRLFALVLAGLVLAGFLALPALVQGQQAQPSPAPPDGGLTAFASEAELAAYVRGLDDEIRRRVEEARRQAEEAERLRREVIQTCIARSTVTRTPGAVTPTGRRGAVLQGRAVDADGEPIAQATLGVRGATRDLRTDADGHFSLDLDPKVLEGRSAVEVQGHSGGWLAPQREVAIQTGDRVEVELVFCEVGAEVQRARYASGPPPAPPPPAAEAEMAFDAVGSVAEESVTNNQHVGVDEGGIVKRRGDFLVVLRRGRLFTVRVGDQSLQPVSMTNAYGPDIEPSGTWYDEMLITGRTVLVVGYSYSRGGTEIGLFDLSPEGVLTYQSTYHLSSNDYYSARNYASRVVDGRLVFYAPLGLRMGTWDGDLPAILPGLRRWDGDGQQGFTPIASATSVYRPARELDPTNVALHTVTSCDVGGGELDCTATAVFGPFSHTFYTSPSAVYVWTGTSGDPSVAYRMPLDGSRPGAIGAMGGPVDQFSFLEADGHLQVLLSEDGGGQWMWRSERPQSGLALLRVPVDAFGDGAENAPDAWYQMLPEPRRGRFVNRFVGDYVLYGSQPYHGRQSRRSRAFAANWRTGAVHDVWLQHGVERIEALGRDALLVGMGGESLYLTPLRLQGQPAAAEPVAMQGLMQGENRSHGFFYRPQSETSGMLGLPVRNRGGRYASLRHGSASIVYLQNDALELGRLGALEARPEPEADDGCVASCVDWYGNARPLFLGDRVFALMGYELVEGTVRRGQIEEVRRVSFAPGRYTATR